MCALFLLRSRTAKYTRLKTILFAPESELESQTEILFYFCDHLTLPLLSPKQPPVYHHSIDVPELPSTSHLVDYLT